MYGKTADVALAFTRLSFLFPLAMRLSCWCPA
jgi:hypothetical protein